MLSYINYSIDPESINSKTLLYPKKTIFSRSMIRTTINLENSDKKWLDKQAHLRRLPMAALIREAVKLFRQKIESEKEPSFDELLLKTAGLWQQADGLEYQRKLREEWE